MTSSHSLPVSCQWFSWLASALDRRSAPRLALLFLGAVLAGGRRTITSWIRAAKLSGQFRPCYTAVAAAGKKAASVAARLAVQDRSSAAAVAGSDFSTGPRRRRVLRDRGRPPASPPSEWVDARRAGDSWAQPGPQPRPGGEFSFRRRGGGPWAAWPPRRSERAL